MSNAPSAMLFIATGCQHCPAVLQSLSELIKEGLIGQLDITNIVTAPEKAQQYNVRSVPWVKIGEFELTGLRSKSELKEWIEKATSPEENTDMSAYFEELMTSGELEKVHQIVREKPNSMSSLFNIMANEDSSLSARIGVGAVIENLAGDSILIETIPTLAEYTQHKRAQVRNDACYYLGLTHNEQAKPFIEALLKEWHAPY